MLHARNDEFSRKSWVLLGLAMNVPNVSLLSLRVAQQPPEAVEESKSSISSLATNFCPDTLKRSKWQNQKLDQEAQLILRGWAPQFNTSALYLSYGIIRSKLSQILKLFAGGVLVCSSKSSPCKRPIWRTIPLHQLSLGEGNCDI